MVVSDISRIPGQTKKSHVSNCGWLDIPSDGPYSTLGEREVGGLFGRGEAFSGFLAFLDSLRVEASIGFLMAFEGGLG